MKKTGEKAEEVARQLAISLQQSIITKSPVDTGRFRNNWVYGINAVDATTTEDVDKSGADTLKWAKATLQHFKAGDTIYITNSLPYAQTLEYGLYPNPPKGGAGKTVGGYSTQAKAGMVCITVVEFCQYIEKVIAELK